MKNIHPVFFKGGDGYQFDLVNDKLAGSCSEYFQLPAGKVAGLQITNVSSTGTPSIIMAGGYSLHFF